MSSLRMASFGSFALILTFGSLIGTAAEAQQVEQQRLPAPRVSVSCSVTRPGTGVATAWLNPGVRATITRLDVTVFHRGFERSKYARFQLTADPARPVMSDSSSARDDSLPAYQLRVAMAAPVSRPGAGGGPSQDAASVAVDGLEDGINYSLRVVVLNGRAESHSAIVRVVGPTCPDGRSDQ